MSIAQPQGHGAPVSLSAGTRALPTLLLFAIFALSLPTKLLAAQLMVWDLDYVPLIARGAHFLFDGGPFPVYGTLSSVAAYNMPFLVWMQLPALALTHEAYSTLLITQLTFNLLATWAVYRLGRELFSPAAGLAAAALFTFSDTGISSAYTAWAQLLLPCFFVCLWWGLWRWRLRGQAAYGGLALVVATAAFMTHFSAILYYPLIVLFALLARPPLRWRPLLVGGISALVLLAPYALFQTTRGFADWRAFFNRQTLVTDEVLASYAYLKPENQAPPATADTPPPARPRPSAAQRLLDRALALPQHVVAAFGLFLSFSPATLAQHAPPLFSASQWGAYALGLLFVLGGAWSAGWCLWRFRHGLGGRWQRASHTLTQTAAGRYTLLLIGCLALVAGLIATGATPTTQPTYYFSLFAVQYVLVGAAGVGLYSTAAGRWPRWRALWGAVGVAGVLTICSLTALDRMARVLLHDWTIDSALNRWSYAAVASVADWIATDWQGGSDIRVSYDIMPENANLWWVAPWHTVDPSYRIGMSYDALLSLRHGLHNANDNPLGVIAPADYIIVYEDGLARYNPFDYDIQRLGAIYVLKARR